MTTLPTNNDQYYHDFIEKKLETNHDHGFHVEIDDLNPALFPFQKVCVQWALKKGRAALFESCGLGKTIQQLEFAKKIHEKYNEPVFILAPLGVSKQTVRDGKTFGYDVNLCKSQDDVINGINISNYEKIEKFDLKSFKCLVIDECFAPETLIEIIDDNGSIIETQIKNIKVGDKLFNANGEDYVHQIYKRPINRAIQISINGRNITCSENHPFFTMYGWKCAQDLQSGDYLMATDSAMRLVRGDFQSKISESENAKILQSILLSEMEDEHSRALCQSTYKRSCSETREKPFKMVKVRKSKSYDRDRSGKETESYEQSGNKEESICYIAEDEAQTFRAWGEWSSNDKTAAIDEGCIVRELDTGICYITGKTSSRFSNMLQGRFRKSRSNVSNRDRWEHTLQQESPRPEKEQEAWFIRVEGIKILESRDHRLDQYRDESGIIYFYDIKAKQHPSYSVNGLLVHNSSILKTFSGVRRNQIIDMSKGIPYKLACSATPSPNNYPELGNHAEFLEVKTLSEMKAEFFVHDSGETQKYRLRGWGVNKFWEWIASWAIMIEKPSDLGFENEGFDLPPITYNEVKIPAFPLPGDLFVEPVRGLQGRQRVRRETVQERCQKVADMVNETDGICLVFCELNDESYLLAKLINDSVEVAGRHTEDYKTKAMEDFAAGNIKCLISKTKICGFGMNFQVGHNMFFTGMSDSFEKFYQAVRRMWRFGQIQTVTVNIIIDERETSVMDNVKRKQDDFNAMLESMKLNINLHSDIVREKKMSVGYELKTVEGDGWTAYHGDCIDAVKLQDDNSIDFNVFSPPFVNLYKYSDSPMDMGNSKNYDEFFKHFAYLVPEILRTTKPGRLCAVHCTAFPLMKERDGVIGLEDFPGDIVRLFKSFGWVYHAKYIIWKNPLTEVTRTKAKGLQYKELVKDSTCARAGIPDEIRVFRKPGNNQVPVTHKNEFAHEGYFGDDKPDTKGIKFHHHTWQHYASPVWDDTGYSEADADLMGEIPASEIPTVWYDVRQGDTLNFRSTGARHENDEAHICALQIPCVKRLIHMYSKSGEKVASWFGGIGTEGFVAIEMGRETVLAELKETYFNQLVRNLERAKTAPKQQDLFTEVV